MRRFQRLLPWIVVLSVSANIYLLSAFWQREAHANRYLWGNMTNHLIAGVTWAGNGRDPEALVALELLDAMRSLPRYEQRVDEADLQTMERFLRSASLMRNEADRERRETGTQTEETTRRLALVRQGFELTLSRLHQVNELKKEAHTFDHEAWKALWHGIAEGLRELRLPPS